LIPYRSLEKRKIYNCAEILPVLTPAVKGVFVITNSFLYLLKHENSAEMNFYSCRKATIGSTLAARMAGYIPKRIPIVTLIESGSRIPFNVINVIIPEKYVIKNGIRVPTPNPMMPPVVDKTVVSIRN
jgi:hypothetical protein